jgi:hypothetical protein
VSDNIEWLPKSPETIIYLNKNQKLLSILCNYMNMWGSLPCITEEARGLPHDFNPPISIAGLMASYLTLKEILDYNWNICKAFLSDTYPIPGDLKSKNCVWIDPANGNDQYTIITRPIKESCSDFFKLVVIKMLKYAKNLAKPRLLDCIAMFVLCTKHVLNKHTICSILSFYTKNFDLEQSKVRIVFLYEH